MDNEAIGRVLCWNVQSLKGIKKIAIKNVIRLVNPIMVFLTEPRGELKQSGYVTYTS